MRTLIALSFWLLAALFPAGAHAAVSPILSPTELAARLGSPEVVVLDIRPPEEYAKGHIPGALSAPYGSWRGPARSPGQLPPLEALTAQVRKLGLTQDSRIVVTSSGEDVTDFGAAARVYWTLKYLGLKHLAVLNGGMLAWKQAAQPLSRQAPQAPAPSQYEPQVDTSILATQADVLDAVGQERIRLVDARPTNFYEGQAKAPTAAIPGTIQGAVNLPHSLWFEPKSTRIVQPEKARQIAALHFPELTDDTITFCNTGHWAATDWFALSELAGLPGIRMYPQSLADWTNTADPLPMENTPGRARQIFDKFKALFN